MNNSESVNHKQVGINNDPYTDPVYGIKITADQTKENSMGDDSYPFHHRSEVDVNADAHRLFVHLDDHRRLSAHMEKPSLMMAGATMQMEMDAQQGRAIGSLIRVTGHGLGVKLFVEEVVTERVPSLRKTLETRGEPKLLVIGSYRMGFIISPHGNRSHLVVFIDYQIPPRGFAHLLGRLFSRTYAAWCTQRMANDVMAAFAGVITL